MLHTKDRKAISHTRRLAALLAATALAAPSFAQSLPTGGTVAAGNAAIGAEANGAITINQTSANAVINWQSFNIGAGNSVNFVQPGASSAILNRVTSATTTTIAGQLNANGQVYLINPNGIAITATGTVNAGAFVASTLGISDDEFIAGKRTFTGNGASRAVTNAGRITIDRGGYLALIGGSVENSGTINVPMGRAALGSGEQATLDLSGDGFLQVAIATNGQGQDALVSNSGTISANGGMVQLSAAAARDVARQAVNMSGTVEARGVSGKSGDITLFGGEGKVVVSGRLDAGDSGGKGGSVSVASREIALASAHIDASGTTGGGTIHIGGERQGGGTLAHADTLSVDAGTTINANATTSGNGGDVVLWSDSLTSFAGAISARGGAVSGNGGQAEVSGKARLAYSGFTDLSAPNGAFGTLLLDPYNVTISTGANTGGFEATGDDSVINATTLMTALSGANVMVFTGYGGAQTGTITVAAPLSWTAATTLTLNAASTININAAITAASGGLALVGGNTISATAAISIGGTFDLRGGIWVQNSATLPDFYARDFQLNGNAFLRVTGGDGSSGTPYQVADVYGLQGIGSYASYPGFNWVLANDIDATGTVNWADTAGFKPIGTDGSDFYGTFNGQGHAITGLVIDRPDVDGVGLFGTTNPSSVIRDVSLLDASIRGRGGVGGLVGNSSGYIIGATVTGSVRGASAAGGLAGYNNGIITLSHVSGSVAAIYATGGLVGFNNGNIAQSYASGSVVGGDLTGGLVGTHNYGIISQSYSSSSVLGAQMTGGLVGKISSGTVEQAYATGSVTGSYFVGGLAGLNDGTIDQTYASGRVTGGAGLVEFGGSGTISNSYWDQGTTGQTNPAGGGTGLTTAEARLASSYAGWDFGTVWYQSGDMRPILRAEAATAVNGVTTITNLHQLALMGANVAGNYALGADIEASATAGTDAAGIWSAGGFVPIGDTVNSFSGQLDGQGHVIAGLVINRPNENQVGLFGITAAASNIANIGLVGGTVTGYNSVGGLIGTNLGSVTNAFSGAAINGGLMTGGLVGVNAGTIIHAYATGAVSGYLYVGGLAGTVQDGSISQSYATGAVSGNSTVGGLVGNLYFDASIRQSYATGAVSGTTIVGGLVGRADLQSSTNQAYATGAVHGDSHVGGLIGENASAIVVQVYATGAVSGGGAVGGLIGQNYGTVFQAYASGAVTATGSQGGLVGEDFGVFVSSDWDMQTSGQMYGAGISNFGGGMTGLTTAQMQDPFSFIDAGWDFAGIWGKSKSGGTPVLRSVTSDPIYDYYVRLAGDTSTTYGDTVGTSAIGLAGVGTGNVSIDWGSAIGTTTNAGSYGYGASNVLALTYSAGSAGDYYIDYGTGALTIDKRALTVTAGNQSRPYGKPTGLTYTATGLVNNDTLHGSLSAAGSEPGSYAITQGSLMASANYDMSFVGGVLTVEMAATPAPGTMASANATAYGTGPFAQLHPLFPEASTAPDGSRILIDDPQYAGTAVCLDNGGGCATLSAQANP